MAWEGNPGDFNPISPGGCRSAGMHVCGEGGAGRHPMLADLPKSTMLSPWGGQGGLGEPRAWPRAAPRQRGTPCGGRSRSLGLHVAVDAEVWVDP